MNTHEKTGHSIKIKLIISALGLLICALGFNAMLSLSALEKLYVESFVSKYSTIGKDLQRKLEKSINFGKTIQNFIGMNELLEETKENLIKSTVAGTIHKNTLSDGISVSVVSEGMILYSTDNHLTNTRMITYAKTRHSYLRYKNSYIILLPIISLKKEQIASILIAFDNAPVKALFMSVLIENCKIIAGIILCGSLLLFFFLSRILSRSDAQSFPKTRISIVMFLVVGISQIVFTGWNTYSFKNYYLQISREKVSLLTSLLKRDIEYLLNKGIRTDKLIKMDASLGEIVAAAPELENIIITDFEGKHLYAAYKNKGNIDFQKALSEDAKTTKRLGSDQNYSISLQFQKAGNPLPESEPDGGKIVANISKAVLFGRLKEIVFDAATVLVISLLFFVEMLILIFNLFEKSFVTKDIGKIRFDVIRPVSFLFIFGSALTVSFLPLYMKELGNQTFLKLSAEMMLGLPISVKVFCTGIAIIVAGAWVDKRGWHEPFLIGLLLSAIGSGWSWKAASSFQFIVSMGIVGVGYGLGLMASQGFVIAVTDEHHKTQGLAQLWAGVYAGSICGSATGAMLADRFGYRIVFLVSAMILVLVILYSFIILRKNIRSPKTASDIRQQSLPTFEVFRFLSDRNIFALILLSSIPAEIAIIGLLNYFSPIYLNQLGVSQSDIGRVFMINGLSMIYLGPIISRYADGSPNKKIFILANGVLGSLAFIVFYLYSGLGAILTAVLILGLANSFAASRSAYTLRLRISQEVGQGKALGIMSAAGRIGQALGPLMFGLIATGNMSQSIPYFGLGYLLLTLLLFLIIQSDTQIARLSGKL